jgi:hypothetical protein
MSLKVLLYFKIMAEHYSLLVMHQVICADPLMLNFKNFKKSINYG